MSAVKRLSHNDLSKAGIPSMWAINIAFLLTNYRCSTVKNMHIYSPMATELSSDERICHITFNQSRSVILVKEAHDTSNKSSGESKYYPQFKRIMTAIGGLELTEKEKTQLGNYDFIIKENQLHCFCGAVIATVA